MVFLSRFGIRIRLLLLCGMAIAPAVGLSYYSFLEERDAAIQHIQEDVEQVARLIAINEYQPISNTRELLFTLSRVPAIQQLDVIESGDIFAEILRQHEGRYANIGMVSPSGWLLASGVSDAPPMNMADRKWFQLALTSDDFVIGEYLVGRITQHPLIGFGYPLRDAGHNLKAVLFAGLNVSRLAEINRELAKVLPEGTSLTLTDQEGTVIMHYPESDQWTGNKIPYPALFRAMIENETGFTEAGEPGARKIFAFATAESNLLGRYIYVALGFEKAKLFAPANRDFHRDVLWTFGAGLFVFGIAWVGFDLGVLRLLRAMNKAAVSLARDYRATRVGPPYPRHEIGELAQAFDQMADTLATREGELRALGARLTELEETQRKELARELHDQVGQTLTALGINLHRGRMQCAQGQMAPALDSLSGAIAQVEHATEVVRDVMSQLRPSVLDDYGLLAALRWYAEVFSKRTGLAVDVEGAEPQPRLSPHQEIALFRIAMEALTNVAKHADADLATITLTPGHPRIRLCIEDKGQGFDPESAPRPDERSGWGLITMRERAFSVGAELRVQSKPGEGTTVTVEVDKES